MGKSVGVTLRGAPRGWDGGGCRCRGARKGRISLWHCGDGLRGLVTVWHWCTLKEPAEPGGHGDVGVAGRDVGDAGREAYLRGRAALLLDSVSLGKLPSTAAGEPRQGPPDPDTWAAWASVDLDPRSLGYCCGPSTRFNPVGSLRGLLTWPEGRLGLEGILCLWEVFRNVILGPRPPRAR